MEYRYLNQINSSADLKKVPREDLPIVASELRNYMVSVIAKIGGHLASSLGAVELTIALHYLFDTPRDKIVWDVGHQAYGHKILTGRRDRFPTIRQYGGISGFPVRDESPYDAFNVAHAGTAISGALGMAVARDLKGENFHVVAVVGDAGLTTGLELEGLNNLGTLKKKVLVVLNDNKMSISPNVGAFAGYLNRIVHGQAYHRLREEAEKMIRAVPRLGPRLLKLSRELFEIEPEPELGRGEHAALLRGDQPDADVAALLLAQPLLLGPPVAVVREFQGLVEHPVVVARVVDVAGGDEVRELPDEVLAAEGAGVQAEFPRGQLDHLLGAFQLFTSEPKPR